MAFTSDADNLVVGDTNRARDAFVYDRKTGKTTRVSVGSSGAQGNKTSASSAISADGRYVAFSSYADNLVAGDTNSTQDVFVHDRKTGKTTRVSVDSSGAQQGNDSYYPYPIAISADGRYVAFYSGADNLVAGDTNSMGDAFVHDRKTGKTTRVSVSSAGELGNEFSAYSAISADGRYVAFYSAADNLVAGDTNSMGDAFVHDRKTGKTTRVSVDSSGAQGNNTSSSQGPRGSIAISAGGRYVALTSKADNLVVGDTNSVTDAFVHDRGAHGDQ